MFDLAIYEDSDFKLTLGFFGIGRARVLIKGRGITIKTRADEAFYFSACVSEMNKRGVVNPAEDARLKPFYRDFCDAVASQPGSVRNRVFFEMSSPPETAARYV